MKSAKNLKNIPSAEKAALILLALGEDLAGEILKNMDHHEVIQVVRALKKTGHTPQATLDEVLAEFYETLQDFHKIQAANPRGFLKGIQKSLEKSSPLLANNMSTLFDDVVDWATPSLCALVNSLAPDALASYLTREHPQTMAILLAHLESAKAGAVLRLLAESLHVELIQRLARLGPVAPETLATLEETLREALASGALVSLAADGNHLAQGTQKVADLLGQLSRDEGQALLAQLKERDPGLFAAVSRKLFTFVDLTKIEPQDLMKIIQETPQKILLASLRDCPQAVLSAIEKAHSPRAWQRLMEDAKSMGPMRRSEVDTAQQEILERVRAKINSGQIILRDPREVYV